MKKILKLMPEYQCYPLWLYDSDGTLIDNIIPESLQANKELMDALTSVQQQFDALYTNAPQTYPYVGFPTRNPKNVLFTTHGVPTSCCATPHGTNTKSFMPLIMKRFK